MPAGLTLAAQASRVLPLGGLAYLVGREGVGTGKPIINRLLFQNDGATPWHLLRARPSATAALALEMTNRYSIVFHLITI